MKATISDNVLTITIPLNAPRPSASGKTLTVATSGGNVETDCVVSGRKVKIGVNAFIPLAIPEAA